MKSNEGITRIFEACFLGLLVVSSLCFSACWSRVEENSGAQTPATPVFIPKERAIEIARNSVSKESDLKFLDSSISENQVSWIVTFDLKPEFQKRTGGPSVVVIDKKTGEVTSLYVSK